MTLVRWVFWIWYKSILVKDTEYHTKDDIIDGDKIKEIYQILYEVIKCIRFFSIKTEMIK